MNVLKPRTQERLWTREFCVLCAIVLTINVGMQMLNGIRERKTELYLTYKG